MKERNHCRYCYYRILTNYGFKSVTVDDIALKMGVSKKTIYAHFPKKGQL